MEMAPPPKKEKKEKRKPAATVEPMDGGAGAQAVDQIGVPPPPVPAAFQARAPSGGRVEAVPLGELFPLPGATAEPEEWQRAFMLQPSQMPQPTGAQPVNGAPTLWRQITPAASAAVPVPMSPVPSNISERLDQLTRQLETLTGPAPMQGTAELFLFVGIGLLLLLAIDTLLRFASNVATKRKTFMSGGARGFTGRRWVIV